MRWRIIHYINLNNICKVVSSQRVSLNAGQESSPQHGLLPFRRQSCGTVAAGRVPFASVTTARCWQCSRSSQSIRTDKSIKIGKSDSIDIDCIDQLVKIDDTLVLLIALSWFLPISSISYWKIHLFKFVHQKMKTDFMQRQQIYWELSWHWESSYQTFITFKYIFKKVLSFR